MLRRFGQTEIGCVAERVAKTCLLVPPEASNDNELPMRLADRALKKDPESGWNLCTKGLASYRAGEFGQSLGWLRKAKDAPPTDGGRYYCLSLSSVLLAMTYHQLDQVELARKSLDEATRLIHEQLPKAGTDEFNVYWHDWLQCHILLREAKALIK